MKTTETPEHIPLMHISRNPRRSHLAALAAVLMAVALLFTGCGSGGSTGSAPSGESGSSGQVGEVTGTGEPVPGDTAFEGIDAADEEASGWQDDAELYAIAAATPQLNARGEAPVWLYTYVSESAGAVASVTVEGGQAEIDPPQELPAENIGEIVDNLLPARDDMLDSSEAISEAPEVVAVLDTSPGTEAAAGLDSFSGGSPDWIFSTVQDGERVEQRVPATGG